MEIIEISDDEIEQDVEAERGGGAEQDIEDDMLEISEAVFKQALPRRTTVQRRSSAKRNVENDEINEQTAAIFTPAQNLRP